MNGNPNGAVGGAIPMPMRPSTPNPNPLAQRTASAFAEVKALEDQHNALIAENDKLRREIDRVTNQRDLLDQALRQERIDCKVYQRKLIRLATAMAGIGTLTAEAEKIMRDVVEFNEAQDEVEGEGREPPAPQT